MPVPFVRGYFTNEGNCKELDNGPWEEEIGRKVLQYGQEERLFSGRLRENGGKASRASLSKLTTDQVDQTGQIFQCSS